MAIKNRVPAGANSEWQRWRRKADQEWDLAGMARQDGDMDACARHTEKAREYSILAREALG